MIILICCCTDVAEHMLMPQYRSGSSTADTSENRHTTDATVYL